jgi:hypothetical protein
MIIVKTADQYLNGVGTEGAVTAVLRTKSVTVSAKGLPTQFQIPEIKARCTHHAITIRRYRRCFQ